MKIRKATKSDFEDYYQLKKQEEKEYSKIIGEPIGKISKGDYKKEFYDAFSSNKNIILIAEENKNIIGFLYGTVLNYYKSGNIEVIFISKEFRNKGVGTSLIEQFNNFLKKKNCKKIRLSVNTKNKNAISLYEDLGFKIKKFEMEMKL